MPECVRFSFVFKTLRQEHSGLCYGWSYSDSVDGLIHNNSGEEARNSCIPSCKKKCVETVMKPVLQNAVKMVSFRCGMNFFEFRLVRWLCSTGGAR